VPRPLWLCHPVCRGVRGALLRRPAPRALLGTAEPRIQNQEPTSNHHRPSSTVHSPIQPLKLCAQRRRRRLSHHRAIRENDRWHAAKAAIDTLHIGPCAVILLNINIFKSCPVLLKNASRPAAVTTPACPIHHNSVLGRHRSLHPLYFIPRIRGMAAQWQRLGIIPKSVPRQLSLAHRQHSWHMRAYFRSPIDRLTDTALVRLAQLPDPLARP
jgi:hypothetical protein